MFTHCPDLHSDPISLVLHGSTKWKIQFMPNSYELETFPNQPSLGQRKHHQHHPPRMLYSIKVGKRGSVILQVAEVATWVAAPCTWHVRGKSPRWATRSQLSNWNGTWRLLRRLSSQQEVCVLSAQHLTAWVGALSRKNISSFFCIYSKFLIL